MKNKVLVEVYVPEIDESFEIYLPLNKNVANIIVLICKSISEIRRLTLPNANDCFLYNRDTGYRYEPTKVIKESDIRNSTRLLLM